MRGLGRRRQRGGSFGDADDDYIDGKNDHNKRGAVLDINDAFGFGFGVGGRDDGGGKGRGGGGGDRHHPENEDADFTSFAQRFSNISSEGSKNKNMRRRQFQRMADVDKRSAASGGGAGMRIPSSVSLSSGKSKSRYDSEDSASVMSEKRAQLSRGIKKVLKGARKIMKQKKKKKKRRNKSPAPSGRLNGALSNSASVDGSRSDFKFSDARAEDTRVPVLKELKARNKKTTAVAQPKRLLNRQQQHRMSVLRNLKLKINAVDTDEELTEMEESGSDSNSDSNIDNGSEDGDDDDNDYKSVHATRTAEIAPKTTTSGKRRPDRAIKRSSHPNAEMVDHVKSKLKEWKMLHINKATRRFSTPKISKEDSAAGASSSESFRGAMLRVRSELMVLRSSVAAFNTQAAELENAVSESIQSADARLQTVRAELSEFCTNLYRWPDYLDARRGEFQENQHAWLLDCEDRVRKLIHEEMDVHEYAYKSTVNKLRELHLNATKSSAEDSTLYATMLTLGLRGLAILSPYIAHPASLVAAIVAWPFKVGKTIRESTARLLYG